MNNLTMRYALILMSEAFTVMAEALREEETIKKRKEPIKLVCPICGKQVGGAGNYVQHAATHNKKK